jgi:hypothetical protein
MSDPIQPIPKKPFTKFKLALYLLAALGLVWLGIQAYWGFFKFKLWVAGFGTGAFWVIGLISGFIYFYMAHKFHLELKGLPQGIKKIIFYSGFIVGLLVINPIPISLVLWVFTPPGGIHTMAYWFFIGCAIGSGIVLVLERLFAKKPPKP